MPTRSSRRVMIRVSRSRAVMRGRTIVASPEARPALGLAARPCWSRYSFGQLQPGADRPVIRSRRREHLAPEHTDATPYEDVVDLTVRAPGRPRAPADGTIPTPHHGRDRRTPEVAVAGDDPRTAVARRPLAHRNIVEVQRREPPRASTTCARPTTSTACARRRSTVRPSVLRGPGGSRPHGCPCGIDRQFLRATTDRKLA